MSCFPHHRQDHAGKGDVATRRETPAARTTPPRLFCAAAILVGLAFSVLGCARQAETVGKTSPASEGRLRVAVFPVENLSGGVVPSGAIRTLLMERLKRHGITLLDDETLDRVAARNRVRYTAGVEPGIAKALKAEAGVDAVLIPSVELYDDKTPPRIAMFCRLVSTGDNPAVLWIDAIGMAGDDSPGILGLGLIEEPLALLTKAVETLAGSLARDVSVAGNRPPMGRGARKFRPKIVYRSEVLDSGKKYSIAIMPFFNKSGRKYAGEIIALHMIRNLMTFQNIEIVEPGIVRQELLRFRIIMSDGVSLPDTETILGAVNADLVLNGEVLDYWDSLGAGGNPKVDFSVLFIERSTRKVVYSSYSQNEGSDGVRLFDWGRVNTAHAMASQMARAIGERMLMGDARIPAGAPSTKGKSEMPR